MKIVLCPHAQERLKERQITFNEIKDTIENYGTRAPTRHRRRMRVTKKIGEKIIKVIYEQKDGHVLVITCAKLDKEGD